MAPAAVELCPAAIVRVAAFPLAAVEALAEPELAAVALQADAKDMSSWAAYGERYAEAIAGGRARLWACTADDPRFMRALTLSNPELAATIAGSQREPRTKRVRHRETSLYRHLARAVGRPEPNGMWAGVALARVGEGAGIDCRPAPARCAFAPELAPFVALMAGLAPRPEYLANSHYKINPTLRNEATGRCFDVPGPGDRSSTRRVPPSRALERAIAALNAGPAIFTRAEAAALLRDSGFTAADSAGLIGLLCEQGLLVGGLRFPASFTSPWDALEQAARALLPADAELWRDAVARLRAQCERLATTALELSPADLMSELRAARRPIAALADALGLPRPELPRVALRCDMQAPFEITLGRAVAARLAATVVAFTGFVEHVGMGGALGPALIDRWLGRDGQMLAGFTPPPSLREPAELATWEGLGEELGPTVAARAAAWGERLSQSQDDIVIDAPGAPGETPLASLLFSFGALAGGSLVVRGLVRDATPAFARCSDLLEPGGGPATLWFAAQYAAVATVTGVDQAAIAFSHACPNVQACPDLVAHRVDVWAASPETVDLRGARIARDRVTHAPVCVVPGRARPLAIHSFTAAQPAGGDPLVNLLLVTSMRTPPQVPRGDRLGFRAELRSGRHSPRVRLAEGTVVRTRRTALVGDDLRALIGAPAGAARFAVWQRFAAERGWPALVLVHRDGEPPLLVARDAPLAIEAMSEGAGGCTCITVEEFIDDAWISAAPGDRRVAELSLPVVRPALLAELGARVAAAQRLADCA